MAPGTTRKSRWPSWQTVAIVAVLSIALAGCEGPGVARPPAAAPFEERLEAAFSELERRESPVIVAVAHGADPIVYREFGTVAADGVSPAATQVDVNSITKTCTAVLAAKLVEQGRMEFATTLDEVFDGVPADKRNITLHQLLTHTAGFPPAIGKDDEQIGKEAYLRRAFETKLIAAPGETYRYSNTGYSIVAAIIEKASGMPYEDFLEETVASVLGLGDTGYAAAYDDNRSMRTAAGKTIREASWGGHAPGWNLIGNGGLVSTAADFMRFRQAVADGRIVSAETLAIIQSPHVAENAEGTSYYGYGLVVQDIDDIGRIYWHDGGNDVFSAQWNDFVDKEDLIFTAGADSSNGNAFEAMRLVASYLYPAAKGALDE
jgi:CubicO group peptidase (beta-lactamase class C family)